MAGSGIDDGAVALLLLIAVQICLPTVARSTGRTRELALRLSLANVDRLSACCYRRAYCWLLLAVHWESL